MASGEEVTGLHAFDELDQVSTVSALNVMPEEEDPQYHAPPARAPLPPPARAGSLPPPPPSRASAPPAPRSSLPPPPSSARPPAQLGRSMPPLGMGRPSPLPAPSSGRPNTAPPGRLAPPPPRGGMGGASVPPPPSRAQLSVDLDDGDADTRVVPNAHGYDSDHAPTATQGLPPVGALSSYDTFADSDADHTSVRFDPSLEGATEQNVPVAAAAAQGAPAIDDTALLELSATTVATDIDMDWDEEEVATKLREEAAGRGLNAVPGGGNPSPFGARSTTLPPGANGGMFAVRPGVRSSFPPPVPTHAQAPSDDWEDEDEAMTQVREPADLLQPAGAVATSWSGFPAPSSARASTVELDSPNFDEPTSATRWPWAVLAAAAVIGAAIAAKTMLHDDPGSATVTLVTKPGDSQVAIDGRALVGQSSPFMVQDLAPGVDHEVVVRKEGFEPQTRRFRVGAGQVMPLDGIELTKLDAGTGFALATAPAGAKVFVDGALQDGVTPLRVTDLEPGLHTIRVEHPDGLKPWESQVALARGQVIELPAADLTGSAKSAPVAGRSKAASEPREREKVASSSSSSKSSKRSKGSERRAAARAARASASAAPAVRPAPSAPAPRAVAVAAAPAAGGADGGALRVNSRPWSQVFVDGRLVGNTPLLNLPLKAGKHKVKLVNPDMQMSKQLTVQIDKGKATTKVVELQ